MAKSKRKPKAKSKGKQAARQPRAKERQTVVQPTKGSKVKSQATPLGASIFTVANDDLGRLTPAGAVELLRDILWADARRVAIPTTDINVSLWVDVPDGGIDANIGAAPASLKGAAIKPGRTGFQVKAGTGFQPWQEAQVRKELFGNDPPKKQNLGASVRACLDEGGTYVLVCTGVDLPDAQERQAVGHLRELFAKCGYSNAKVEVWSQNKLIGVLQRFPSLRQCQKISERITSVHAAGEGCSSSRHGSDGARG